MKHSKLSINAAIFFIGKTGALIISVIIPIILVRIFDKTNFGIYSQFILFYNFLLKILQFGINQSLLYFFPLHPKHQKVYVTNTFLFLVFINIMLWGIYLVFNSLLQKYISYYEIGAYLPLLLFFLTLRLISSPLELSLIAIHKVKTASAVAFFAQLVRGILLLAFVYIFHSLSSVFWALIVFAVIRLVFFFLYITNLIGFTINKDSWRLAKKQFNYTKFIGLSGLLSNTAKRFDRILLTFLFPPEFFAIYKIGNFRIPFIQLLFQSIGNVFSPTAVRLLRDKNHKKFFQVWNKLLIRFSFIGILFFFLFQIIGKDLIILLFTNNYSESVTVFRITLALILTSMIPYGLILKTTGHTKYIFRANLISFAFCSGLMFIFVIYFGYIGAASGVVLWNFVNTGLQIYYSKTIINKKLFEIIPITNISKLFFIGTLLLVSIYFLQSLIISPAIRIIASSIIFPPSFIYFSYKFKLYNLLEEPLVRRIPKILKQVF